jgi:Xaa-Pro aminopeptidase
MREKFESGGVMYLLTDWIKRVDFDAQREKRMISLQRKMEEFNLNGLLLFKVENIRFASGVHPSWFPSIPIRNAAVFKLGRKDSVNFVASGNLKHRQQTTYWLPAEDIFPLPYMENNALVKRASENFKKAFAKMGLSEGKVGIDLFTLYILAELQQILPNVRWVDGDRCVKEAMTIKNEEDLKCLGISSQCMDVAMAHALKKVEIGKRECEVLGEGVYALYALGASIPQGKLMVASGEENLFPLVRFATDKMVRYGDLVLVDIGGYFNGMFGQVKRTIVCGKPTPRQKEIYKAVYEAQVAATNQMKPKTRACEIVKVVREIFERKGFNLFADSKMLAHGIGVGGFESPFIGEGLPDFELQEGMVFFLEPTLVVPGVPGGGTVSLGNMVAVTPNGGTVLNTIGYDENLLN